LTNATWLEQQTGALSAVLGQINPQLVSELSHDSLIDLIIFGATKFSILTVRDVSPPFYLNFVILTSAHHPSDLVARRLFDLLHPVARLHLQVLLLPLAPTVDRSTGSGHRCGQSA
jgi:hypothetical protein